MISYCAFCGKSTNIQHHLIFGFGRRDLAEKDNLKISVCEYCHTLGRKPEERIHDNEKAEALSKMLGQALFERNKCADGKTKEEARKEFTTRYGKSYL